MPTYKKRKNPKTGKLFKRGDTRDEDDYLFYSYKTRLTKDGTVPLYWVSPEHLKKLTLKQNEGNKEAQQRWRDKQKASGLVGKKRNVRVGQIRKSDGYIFTQFGIRIKTDGYLQENWRSPVAYHRHKVFYTLRNVKKRSEEQGLEFNLDVEYIKSIFPKDGKCPVLRTKLSWGTISGTFNDCPSLDKINPKKGYVKGNVMWMSRKANTMKSNANPAELKKFATWIKKTVR